MIERAVWATDCERSRLHPRHRDPYFNKSETRNLPSIANGTCALLASREHNFAHADEG